jgi:hypothetical protein
MVGSIFVGPRKTIKCFKPSTMAHFVPSKNTIFAAAEVRNWPSAVTEVGCFSIFL